AAHSSFSGPTMKPVRVLEPMSHVSRCGNSRGARVRIGLKLAVNRRSQNSKLRYVMGSWESSTPASVGELWCVLPGRSASWRGRRLSASLAATIQAEGRNWGPTRVAKMPHPGAAAGTTQVEVVGAAAPRGTLEARRAGAAPAARALAPAPEPR